MNKRKHVFYLLAALGMIVYALPQLKIGEGWTMPTIFGIVWIGFALLVIAAHLHRLLGVDEQMEKQFETIRRMRRQQIQHFILGEKKILQSQHRAGK